MTGRLVPMRAGDDLPSSTLDWNAEGHQQAYTTITLLQRRRVMTVSPAIAAFAAAGNDIDALEKAIEEASFLDATPGEDRQKLRGAHGLDLPRDLFVPHINMQTLTA